MLAPPLRQAQGRGAEAIELVESAADSARRRRLDAEVVWCAGMRARLALLQGDRESVAAWARAYGPSAEIHTADGRPLGYVEEFAEATYARALLALGRAVEAACLIERLLERTEAAEQIGYTIELLALRALVFQARGDAAHALAALERALALAEPEGYVRTFVDEGQPLARLLAEGSPRWAPVSQVYARRLLGGSGRHLPDGQFAGPLDTPHLTSLPRGPSQRLVEPLSAREREVLALLAEGLPNHDIAERLIVSVGTIKRHTGNIYGKLGVTSRTQAILKAQELALL
jgi:LuxR family maltose regulon positive regulatory protein